MDYGKAIEIYTGRSIDFDVDVMLSEIDGVTTIDVWNITEKPQPTIEELETLYTANESTIQRIHELNNIIVSASNTLQRVLLDNTYDIFSQDIADIINSASDEIKTLEQEIL